MIEERARVVEVRGDVAEIVAEPAASCGGCAAKGGCGTSLLAAWLPQRRLTFRLRNEIGAKSGDTVIVGLDESLLQRSSLLLYAAPLLGLLAGAILGERLFLRLGLPTELGAVLSGLLGLSAALLVVHRRTGLHGSGGVHGVRLLRVARTSLTINPEGIGLAGTPDREGFRKYE